MSVRPRYKEQVAAETAAAELNIPEIKINGEQPDHVTGISAEIPHTDKPNEATVRLQKQIDDLKKSEGLQRAYAERMAREQQVAVTPQQALDFWKANGLDQSGEQFLRSHPQHILGLTSFAGDRASQQGHQLGSPAHVEAAKAIFLDSLARLEGAQAQPAVEHATLQDDYPPVPTMQQPPRFRPLPESADEDQRRSIVSAPVSREIPSASGARTSSRQIRLSPDEREAARLAGVSEVEYAKQKQKLIDEKNAGNYGEQRYR